MAQSISASDVKTIIMACEAGMGSSLMVVNTLKKKLKKAQVSGIKVIHKPARAVPPNAQLVVVHKGLANTVRRRAPEAVIVTFSYFMNDPAFDRVVDAFANGGEIANTVE